MHSSRRSQTGQSGRLRTASKHVAERTCMGCHQVHPQDQLVRLVCSSAGQVLLDIYGKLPGRGTYLCAHRACAEQALKGARLQETFRRDVTLTPIDELLHAMANVMEKRARGCIRIARKAGRVVSGYTQVSGALLHGTVSCLLIAEDTGRERRREYEGWCARRQIPCRSFLTKARLGDLAGRAESSALGILEPRLGERLRTYLEGMSQLTEQ